MEQPGLEAVPVWDASPADPGSSVCLDFTVAVGRSIGPFRTILQLT